MSYERKLKLWEWLVDRNGWFILGYVFNWLSLRTFFEEVWLDQHDQTTRG